MATPKGNIKEEDENTLAPDPFEAMMKDAQAPEKQFGHDVKFVSATPVKNEPMEGYSAVYAF